MSPVLCDISLCSLFLFILLSHSLPHLCPLPVSLFHPLYISLLLSCHMYPISRTLPAPNSAFSSILIYPHLLSVCIYI